MSPPPNLYLSFLNLAFQDQDELRDSGKGKGHRNSVHVCVRVCVKTRFLAFYFICFFVFEKDLYQLAVLLLKAPGLCMVVRSPPPPPLQHLH